MIRITDRSDTASTNLEMVYIDARGVILRNRPIIKVALFQTTGFSLFQHFKAFVHFKVHTAISFLQSYQSDIVLYHLYNL